jgi:hypothetical protein
MGSVDVWNRRYRAEHVTRASIGDTVDTSPIREAHAEIPMRKTDARGTHQKAARTSVRHLEQAYIYFIATVKPFRAGVDQFEGFFDCVARHPAAGWKRQSRATPLRMTP